MDSQEEKQQQGMQGQQDQSQNKNSSLDQYQSKQIKAYINYRKEQELDQGLDQGLDQVQIKQIIDDYQKNIRNKKLNVVMLFNKDTQMLFKDTFKRDEFKQIEQMVDKIGFRSQVIQCMFSTLFIYNRVPLQYSRIRYLSTTRFGVRKMFRSMMVFYVINYINYLPLHLKLRQSYNKLINDYGEEKAQMMYKQSVDDCFSRVVPGLINELYGEKEEMYTKI